MNKQVYYSQDLSKLVAWAFLSPSEYKEKYPPKQREISLSLCTIVHNEFGYFDLYEGNEFIKRISYSEYEKYKKYVKNVIDRTVQ